MDDKVPIVIKGIVSLIPYVGGTITTIWSDIEGIQVERKIQRLLGYYSSLEIDLRKVKDKLNQDYISHNDFLDIFEKTSNYIINERNEQKRILFKNIFLNSITCPIVDYDKTEGFMRILEEMNYLEILTLKIFHNPQKFNSDSGNIIKDPNWIRPGVRNGIQFQLTYQLNKMLSDLTKQSVDEIEEALYFLENHRLIKDNTIKYALCTNGDPIETLNNRLTKKGSEFIKYLMNDIK